MIIKIWEVFAELAHKLYAWKYLWLQYWIHIT